MIDSQVAPFTGAWIETPTLDREIAERDQSRPSRARGLKLSVGSMARGCSVAPFTGAWIETRTSSIGSIPMSRRALHGRVD